MLRRNDDVDDVDDTGSFLHSALLGDPAVLPGLRLDTLSGFFLAALFTIVLCLSERLLTLALSARWAPFRKTSRWRTALWRSALYWLATLARLIYMLLAMTLHMPLIVVMVTALSAGQLVIELSEHRPGSRSRGDHESYKLEESSENSSLLPAQPPASSAPLSAPFARPRSKSKPDAIYIHPSDSNIARADALFAYGKDAAARPAEPAWTAGAGRDAARALLAAKPAGVDLDAPHAQHRSKAQDADSERRPLYDSSFSDSDSDESA